MASTDERLAKLRGDIVQDLPKIIAQESDTHAISAIRTALETIEGTGDDERGRSPLWAVGAIGYASKAPGVSPLA